MDSFKENDYRKIFYDWPILQSDLCRILVAQDMIQLYPETNICLERKWDTFFETIYEEKSSAIRVDTGVEFLEIYKNVCKGDVVANSVDLIKFLLLPFMFPCKKSMKKNYKPSHKDVLESLIIWCKDARDIVAEVELRNQKYAKLGFKAQPCIICVGPTVLEINTFYVSFESRVWSAPNFLSTLDFLFHFFTIFNIRYPCEGEHIYVLLQQCVYDIYLSTDLKSADISYLRKKIVDNLC